jgi:hypothetical protein
MRSWLLVGVGLSAWACGGAAFTGDGSGGGAGDDGEAGSQSRSGRGNGGSTVASGGKGSAGKGGMGGSQQGGAISVGGDLGIAGDLVAGGTQPGGGEPGTSGSNTGGTGPDPVDGNCPQASPKAGAPCAAGLSCTYGDDVRAGCRDRATCIDGKWLIDERTQCETLPECQSIEEGKACDANTSPACVLEGYVYCLCTGCTGAGPCSSETVWQCADSPGSDVCPHVLPNEGQACTKQAECDYGACVTDNAMTASCNGTIWQWQSPQCPQ